MLAESPEGFAEEYAIHDYEGFCGYSVSEYEGIELVHEIACFIEEHSDVGGELLNYFSGDIDEAKKAMEENYCGCHASLADYAEELTRTDHRNPPKILFLYRLRAGNLHRHRANTRLE